MKRVLLIPCAAALLILGLLTPYALSDSQPAQTVTVTTTRTETVRVLASYQGKPTKWWAHRAVRNRRQLNIVRHALHEQVQLGASGLERAFLCIHSFEGAWSDPAAPYWGGLQMDTTFMREYGGEFFRAFGTADHWTPSMQLAVAMRAFLSGRRFGPWPNTARDCGLL